MRCFRRGRMFFSQVILDDGTIVISAEFFLKPVDLPDGVKSGVVRLSVNQLEEMEKSLHLFSPLMKSENGSDASRFLFGFMGRVESLGQALGRKGPRAVAGFGDRSHFLQGQEEELDRFQERIGN